MNRLSSRLIGAFALTLACSTLAHGCLVGSWKVRCSKGHDDIVDKVTCNHTCEKCGDKAFSNGNGFIVCPEGHANMVATGSKSQRERWVNSYKCKKCGKECCFKPI